MTETKKRAYTQAQALASRKWNEANYERLDLRVPAELKQNLRKACDITGESQRAFSIAAIEERIAKVEKGAK